MYRATNDQPPVPRNAQTTTTKERPLRQRADAHVDLGFTTTTKVTHPRSCLGARTPAAALGMVGAAIAQSSSSRLLTFGRFVASAPIGLTARRTFRSWEQRNFLYASGASAPARTLGGEVMTAQAE
jgi:hypothetical protein